MRRIAACLLIGLAPVMGCESDEPCQDYIDYICDCHDGEEGFDCNEIEETFGDADADIQDECAINLDEQKDQDDADEHVCGEGTTTEPTTTTTGTGTGTGTGG